MATGRGRAIEPLFATPYGHLTLREIAEIVGITPKAMHVRLTAYKWSQEEAFNTPKHATAGMHHILPTSEYRRLIARTLGHLQIETSKENAELRYISRSHRISM